MIRPIARLVDRERAAHQRLGLREAVRGLEQFGEVVEGGRDSGMILPMARLGDRERAPVRGLGLRISGLGIKQQPKWNSSAAPSGSGMLASSARRARASACGASGSSVGQLRTSCGSPTKAALTQPQSFLAKPAFGFAFLQPSLGKLLYQTMYGKGRLLPYCPSAASTREASE